jgi:hypothetical protein
MSDSFLVWLVGPSTEGESEPIASYNFYLKGHWEVIRIKWSYKGGAFMNGISDFYE